SRHSSQNSHLSANCSPAYRRIVVSWQGDLYITKEEIMKLFRSFAALLVALLALMIVMPLAAHESRNSPDGQYQYVFGWRTEPALTGVSNGPEFYIYELVNGERGERVEGAELQVEVMFGGASVNLPLNQAFRDPGHYVANLIPALPGDYTCRVYGTLGDLALDETFTSADGGFNSVEPAQDIQFPEPFPNLFTLQPQ